MAADASWLVEAVGFAAGALTTSSFVPQVIKTIRSRSTKDISLLMWLLFSLGVGIWVAYGVMTDSYAIIVTNTLTLILSGTVLAIKLKNLTSE
jgi:MtN3 and saliva related transmembrane protein